MKITKNLIKEKLFSQDLTDVDKMILTYQNECPKDFELVSIKTMYFIATYNYDEALAWAKVGVRKNPYNVDANYNLAYLNDMIGNYYEASLYYLKTLILAENEGNQEELMNEIKAQIRSTMERLVNKSKVDEDANNIKIMVEQLKVLQDNSDLYGFADTIFRGDAKIIGTKYQDYSGITAFVGFYDRTANHFPKPSNMIQAKGEIYPIVAHGTEFKVEDGCDKIIPILSETNNELLFQEENEEYSLGVMNPNHFSYYRVRSGTNIIAKNAVHIGKPIPTQYDLKKKKLVLSLFIDGLSQFLLDEEGLGNIMPNTHKFFSKGIICKNVYTAADWTYPSLASYVTGYSLPNHMMINSKLSVPLPTDVTILSEYFSEAGYQTGKLDGDWRSTPHYGYLRGIDRVIYQHQWTGMRTWEVIGDAMDHMELLKDTNHYFWMGLGDLHDIADGISLQASVESKLHIKERVVERGKSSAKQPYSKNKRVAYIHQAKMVDQSLSILYNYIEDNYKNDEIVISLFGDHGQGYLVKPNEFFLSQARTNVAFMFRGGEINPAISDELISTTDYSTIMCKLCNIEMKDENIDGRLPHVFGGKEEREYVLTESLHPKDPYYVSIYWKDYICNFTSIDIAGEDGRFNLNKGYEIQMTNYKNIEIIDEDKKNRNLDIITSHIAGNLIYN